MTLTVKAIQERLATPRYGRSLMIKAETASTNDDARAAAFAGAPDGHVVVAETQTRGRGSRGRTWDSPAGTDLYLSLVARIPVSVAELPPLTLAAGVALAETAEAFLPHARNVQVKWPNDLWVDRKKCAGILVESASLGEQVAPVIVGIGLNVNRQAFPDGLDTPPTSLALSGGQEVDRTAVLSALLGRLEHWIDRFVSDGLESVRTALETRLAMRGEQAQCDGVQGVVEGLSREGALQMRTAEGMRLVISGTLRPLGRP